jgi:hypothetical protein
VRLTRVRRVQRLADVAAHDVAAERVSAFHDVCNSLKQFSNEIFFGFSN